MIDLSNDNVLFTVECKEPEGVFHREVRLSSLSQGKLFDLYMRLKGFKVLFNDITQGDSEAFIKTFIDIRVDGSEVVVTPKGLLFEIDDVGIVFLSDIVPGLNADIHINFWDRRMKGREGLIREIAKFAINNFNLHRLSTSIPAYARPALARIKKYGFKEEGIIRESVLYEGQYNNVHLFGILASEVLNG